MNKYIGTLVLHSAEVKKNIDKTAASALILCSPGAEVILVKLSSLVSVFWCRIKDLALQHWIPEKFNQENMSKAYKYISAVAHDSIQSKVARTTLFLKWMISYFYYNSIAATAFHHPCQRLEYLFSEGHLPHKLFFLLPSMVTFFSLRQSVAQVSCLLMTQKNTLRLLKIHHVCMCDLL